MDKDSITIQSYESVADYYEEKKMDSSKIVPLYHEFLSQVPGDTILDLGCGPGRDAKYFSERMYNVTAVDACKAFVEKAKKNAPFAHVEKMDFRDLQVPNHFYAGAWAMGSFVHLEKSEMPNVLKHIHTKLIPDGTLYFSVKQGDFTGFKEDDFGKRYFSEYGYSELTDLVHHSPFSLLEQFTTKSFVTGHEDITWLNIFARS